MRSPLPGDCAHAGLLFGLDATAEVTPEAHADHTLPVDDSPELTDGRAQPSIAGVALGSELRYRKAIRLASPAPFKGRSKPPPMLLIDLSPA
jgi:hypothetical protein